MFSWFYFFISSLFIKPEVMIRSYRREYMHFFGYEMKFLLIWDLNKINLVALNFFVLRWSIYHLINFLYFFILLIYLEQKTF